jgi:hypothetical protein
MTSVPSVSLSRAGSESVSQVADATPIEVEKLGELQRTVAMLSTWGGVSEVGGEDLHERWSSMSELDRAGCRQVMHDSVWEIHRDVEHALLHLACAKCVRAQSIAPYVQDC